MIVKLLIKHHLEFLSLKGGCRGSSESTHVKMPHCWKSHAAAQLMYVSSFRNYHATAKSTILLLNNRNFYNSVIIIFLYSYVSSLYFNLLT